MTVVASATNYANWPHYRFTHIASRFFVGVKESQSLFQAPNNHSAVRYCALLTGGVLRAIIPGDGTCKVRPLKLVALPGERLVRNFGAEGWTGLDVTCRPCQQLMTATREGWVCPKCKAVTGWV